MCLLNNRTDFISTIYEDYYFKLFLTLSYEYKFIENYLEEENDKAA